MFLDYHKIIPKISQSKYFNLESFMVGNQNFALSTRFFAFPNFDIKKLYGYTAIIVPLENLNKNNIEYYVKTIEDIHYNEEFKPSTKFGIDVNGKDGLSVVGFYKDNNNNYYFIVMTQPTNILQELEEYKVYAWQEYYNTTKFYEKLLRSANAIPEEKLKIIFDEYKGIVEPKVNFLVERRNEYVQLAKLLINVSMFAVTEYINFLINKVNEKSISKITYSSTRSRKIIPFFTMEDQYEFCLCSNMNDQQFVYYNINEGFGVLGNIHPKYSIIVPTFLYDYSHDEKYIKCKYIATSKMNIPRYTKFFSTKEKYLENLKKVTNESGIDSRFIIEKNQLKPECLLLG